MNDPVLVEVLRGDIVESRHHGAVIVLDADGGVVFSLGDVDRPIFPRSAVKALQALPLLETGAADRYDLSDAELALACSSHMGEPMHAETAASMLAKAGRNVDCLECGAHWPMNPRIARELAHEGLRPSALHNNCSGKHSGFVCVACADDIDPAGYIQAGHPVQEIVRATMVEMTGAAHEASLRGTDGCSIPTYAIPLKAMARAFARFGSGVGLGPERAKAAMRLRVAVAAHPEMIAGTDAFDTVLTRAMGARVFLKTGAEGVYCAAIPELGLGLALKCEDGAGRAAEVVMAALVRRLLSLRELENAAVATLERPIMKNWNGLTVGAMRPANLLSE
jgi:L-asparaginase II